MRRIVRLLNIQTISVFQDFENDYSILAAPIIGLEIETVHKPDNLNLLDFTISYNLNNISGQPIFSIKTSSRFSIIENKAAFINPVNTELILLIAQLGPLALAHCYGVYSTHVRNTPLASVNLLQLQTPDDFYEIVSEHLNSRNN